MSCDNGYYRNPVKTFLIASVHSDKKNTECGRTLQSSKDITVVPVSSQLIAISNEIWLKIFGKTVTTNSAIPWQLFETKETL